MPPRNLRQPHAALMDLCDGFFDDLSFLSSCQRMTPEELPENARRLLVHREHMTAVLQRHFGEPVGLRVLRNEFENGQYARKILLTVGDAERIVELGIVRMDFRYVGEPVKAEILSRKAPLGDILIRHNVFRRISPRWYFEFSENTPIAREMGQGSGPVYGRVGTIYCDEEAAIEVLEVVATG